MVIGTYTIELNYYFATSSSSHFYITLCFYSILFYSKSHGWIPKLTSRFFNMNLNNAYLMYKILHKEHNTDMRMMTMPEAMKEATHALLQTGDHRHSLDAVHPPSVRDMTNAYNCFAGLGRSACSLPSI